MDSLITKTNNLNNYCMQFQLTEDNRSTQTVFHDNCITLGFCGSDKEYESTITAISAANYIAGGGYKVALVEPDFSKGTILDKLIPALRDNKTMSCGSVDYYPGWDLTNDIYMVDVVILDFSSMSFEESVYLSKVKKMFLCSDIGINSNQTNKLQNNNSFKYSILYKDNLYKQVVTQDIESIEVFQECSIELKRTLKVILQNYGISITNELDADVNNLLKELNIINKFYMNNVNNANIKIERVEKLNVSDSMNADLYIEKLPMPFQTTEKQQKSESIPILLSNNRNSDLRSSKETDKNQSDQHTANYEKKIYESDKYKTENIFTNQRNSNIDRSEVQENDYYKVISDNRINPYVTGEDMTRIKAVENLSPSYKATEYNNRILPEDKIEVRLTTRPQLDAISRVVEADQYNNRSNNRNLEENNYDEENIQENKVKDGEEYTLINDLNYAEDNRGKIKKKQISNQMLFGKETIFVTGLKHGCGCSHTGLSFARYVLNAYGDNICICHKKGAYDLDDDVITEYTKDTDYDSIFSSNRFIIYDCGILGELNSEQLVELRRCNIKIMVCNGDEKYLGNLSKFIRKLGNTANEWIFAFNLVTSREKEVMIRKIMDGYKICFIPLHDRDELPRKVTKMWNSVVKRNLL